MRSFFVMKFERFFLVRMQILFYRVKVLAFIKKHFTWFELCDRVNSVYRSAAIKIYSSVSDEFCFAIEFAITKIVELMRSTCPFVVEWPIGVVT